MKTRNFILYKILRKIIISINEAVRKFNKKNLKMIKRIFEHENRKKNFKNFIKIV